MPLAQSEARVRKLILIVDDNPDHLTIAAALLKYAGFRVMEAASADAAELVLRTHRPDLILLDLSMPRRDGIEFLLELRADPSTADYPVAAFTSFGDVYYPILRQLGVHDVIDKSLSPSEFVRRVTAITGTFGPMMGTGEPLPPS